MRKSNYIQTPRAKKMPGKTVRVGGTEKIGPTRKGQEAITFKKGALHAALNVPQGEKIPAKKMEAAIEGKYGEAVQKKARFAKNVLAKGRKTAMQKRGK